ncbi:DUF3175 domain-containing protein, partial [Acinetobacter baumannii]
PRHKAAPRKSGAGRKAGKRKTPAGKAPTRKSAARTGSNRRWSQRVTRESDALDLKKGVFRQTSARKIASSLKRSAEQS